LTSFCATHLSAVATPASPLPRPLPPPALHSFPTRRSSDLWVSGTKSGVSNSCPGDDTHGDQNVEGDNDQNRQSGTTARGFLRVFGFLVHGQHGVPTPEHEDRQ